MSQFWVQHVAQAHDSLHFGNKMLQFSPHHMGLLLGFRSFLMDTAEDGDIFQKSNHTTERAYRLYLIIC